MLRIIPLGGLGEIGLNSMVFEVGDERLLVDAGLMFPSHDAPGVDVVVPDLGYLRAQAGRLKGVVLTHGHEDHVGALPYLLRDVPVPVYGTAFTLALVRSRLEEAGVDADLREIGPRSPFRVGEAFTVEALDVCHSVPGSVGCWIRTPVGDAVHTGDFKIDPTPPDGRATDLERFAEAGDRGVACLLSDSTNAEVTHETGSEQEVERSFERLISAAPGRVLVSMFSSNIHRVRHTLALCARLGRKVALNGRSMVRNVEIARELGEVKVPAGLLIPLEEATRLPSRQVLILSTGSQAEPRSGLLQMLSPERDLTIEAGDLVLLSARSIPGNERAIGALINELCARGARVVHTGVDPSVHVSGHASPGQQRRMLEVVRPRCFVPIHGEVRHLQAHLALALGAGVPASSLLFARDGDVLEFADGRGMKVGEVPHGRLFQNRQGGGGVAVEAVKERSRMAESGVVMAAVAIDRATGAIVSGPHLEGRGLAEEDALLLSHAASEGRAALGALSAALRGDDALVKDELARAVRRAFKREAGKRPTVVPLVVKL